MGSYLLVLGDRQALAWILADREMAFSEVSARSAQRLRSGDNLLLYTTRACFRNPGRDRGRVVGQASVSSEVRQLAAPVTFGERMYTIGCSLSLHLLTPFGTGVELTDYVRQMHAFPKADVWMIYLRRTLVALDDHDYNLLMRLLTELAVEPGKAIPEYVAHGTPPRYQSPRRRRAVR